MPESFLTAIAAIANLLFLVGGVYIYLSVVRQVSARPAVALEEGERRFGWPEVVLACSLAALFAFSAERALAQTVKPTLEPNDLIANVVISLGLLVLVAAFLFWRGLPVSRIAGFNVLPLWRVVTTGMVLLFASYPLIVLGDLLSQRVLGVPSSRQGIVEIFSESQTMQERIIIIVLAVGVAPIVEEFVFRFFFYGVVKRYLGRFVGLLTNSVLFAFVHAHIPSAAPLFILGACLTLAYEWSGSILVSMSMHALFNSLTLVALAFPEWLQP